MPRVLVADDMSDVSQVYAYEPVKYVQEPATLWLG